MKQYTWRLDTVHAHCFLAKCGFWLKQDRMTSKNLWKMNKGIVFPPFRLLLSGGESRSYTMKASLDFISRPYWGFVIIKIHYQALKIMTQRNTQELLIVNCTHSSNIQWCNELRGEKKKYISYKKVRKTPPVNHVISAKFVNPSYRIRIDHVWI